MTTVKPADHPLLVEQARGLGLRAIGALHQVSHETARQAIERDGGALIDMLERNLRAGVWPRIEIPPQMPGRRMDALNMLSCCVKGLEDRGWQIEVTTDRAPGSTAFVITTPGRDR